MSYTAIRIIQIHLLYFIPAVLLIRLVLDLTSSRRTGLWHRAGVSLFLCYMLLLLSVTVNYMRIINGHFSLSYRYNLVPFFGIQAVWMTRNWAYILLNLLGNVLLFAPLGFLLPLLWQGWSLPRTTALGAGLSFLIEFVQLFTGRGADVDDLLLNTLGVLLGYCTYLGLCAVLPGFAGSFRKGWIAPRSDTLGPPPG